MVVAFEGVVFLKIGAILIEIQKLLVSIETSKDVALFWCQCFIIKISNNELHSPGSMCSYRCGYQSIRHWSNKEISTSGRIENIR